jgi:PPM family protein phosphatase
MDLESSDSTTIELPFLASAQPSHPLTVRSFGKTDPGRVRKSNEDQFFIAELARTMWVHQTSLPQPQTQHGSHRAHVFLVADGMGGANAGEVASALTVNTVVAYILNILKRFSNLRSTEEEGVQQEFETALQQAHAKLVEETAGHPELSGMGTTFTMAFTSNWKLFVVHAGDSRCYLFRGRQLKQLTSDHTVAGELVRRGVIAPEQAARHMYRHVVTNVVGGTSPGIRVEVQRADLKPDDTLLLCTDGVSDMVPAERMAAILHADSNPQTACTRLITEANAQGGKDNVTAIVARFDATAGHR